jgi:hypothetical protein
MLHGANRVAEPGVPPEELDQMDLVEIETPEGAVDDRLDLLAAYRFQ